jgi:hypothetical protein
MTDGNDNAFPNSETDIDFEGDLDPLDIIIAGGLTKREYFAAMALNGLISSIGQHDVSDYADLASDAVLVADRLIESLNREVTHA